MVYVVLCMFVVADRFTGDLFQLFLGFGCGVYGIASLFCFKFDWVVGLYGVDVLFDFALLLIILFVCCNLLVQIYIDGLLLVCFDLVGYGFVILCL